MSETATAPSPADVTPVVAPTEASDEGRQEEADAINEGTEALGDAGKKALDRMKADLKAAKAEAREAKKALEDASASTEAEKAAREVERQALAKANQRILSAEIRREATGKLADPNDALAFIDITEFDVNDDGEIDAEAIASAVTDLIARKPHLAAQRGETKKILPDGSQGASSSGKSSTADMFASALKDRL
jgi:multidrug efflux pump subunit AcrA (membrane-fusion protein)